MSVGVILLAAGRSRRFGSDKRLAVLGDGQTLLSTSLANACASGLPVSVCLDRRDADLGAALVSEGAAVTLCEDAARGMGHTLAEGIRQRPADWEGVLVALADMPWIRPSSYLEIARQVAPGRIVVPYHAGRRGNPVGFGANFFAALTAITGDNGARDIVASNASAVRKLALNDPGLLWDVDTPEALDEATRR